MNKNIFSILSFIMPFAGFVWIGFYSYVIIMLRMFYSILPRSLAMGLYLPFLAGVVFGVIGLSREEKRKGFAIAGIILSALFAFFIWFVIGAFMSIT